TLELVDLLDDVDGNDDVVVVEAEQRPRIVQQDVGVEDEVLFHRLAGGFPRARPRGAVGLLLLVSRSIGTEPTRPGRSNAPRRGPEQLLNGPGHRRPGHALPGEAPPEASEVEPVGAAPPSAERCPAYDGAQGPGHACVQSRDHQIRRPRHAFDTGPYTAQLQGPGEEPERSQPWIAAERLEAALRGAVHEQEV